MFSPDGTRIAFTHFTDSKLHGEDLDVKEEGARIRVDEGRRLAPPATSRPGFGPSWAAKPR